MKYAVIAATDIDSGFSKNGEIPWYFPEDFKYFRELTLGNICVMGRKTYEDINNRLKEKALLDVLPGRTSYVVSRHLNTLPNATVMTSVEEVVDATEDDERSVFFIGGQSIFEQGLEVADKVYLTLIKNKYDCDQFFPIDYVHDNFALHIVKTIGELTFIEGIRDKPKRGFYNTNIT